MKAPRNVSEVIVTDLLVGDHLDRVMSDIGVLLMAEGYSPLTHTRRLLAYEREIERKRGIYVGLFAPLKWVAPGFGLPLRKPRRRASRVVVQVTDLPMDFRADGGSNMELAAALAFGVSAPRQILAGIKEILAPHATDLDRVKESSPGLLVGRFFEKTMPNIECDHCGLAQEVSVPLTIARVEGSRGYGPGGSISVVCKNPECGKTFEVSWESVVFEIDFI